LIEAMIASVVLAFSVVGVCGVLMAAMQTNKASESQATATEVARLNMDSLAAVNLDDISPANGSTDTESIDGTQLAGSDDADVVGQLTYITRHPTQATRDLAVIAITSTTADGQRVTLYRLATRAAMP